MIIRNLIIYHPEQIDQRMAFCREIILGTSGSVSACEQIIFIKSLMDGENSDKLMGSVCEAVMCTEHQPKMDSYSSLGDMLHCDDSFCIRKHYTID
jgi:hypothetical protein